MRILVPHQDRELEPPSPARLRRFKRHLIESLRDLRRVKRPDRLIKPPRPSPPPDALPLLRSGCAACRGFCCLGGGEHAYLDERTMARVRRDRPELAEHALIAAYVAQVAPVSFQDSCLFHGEFGCTLHPAMRSALCDSFFCTPLKQIAAGTLSPEGAYVAAGPAGWGGGMPTAPQQAKENPVRVDLRKPL